MYPSESRTMTAYTEQDLKTACKNGDVTTARTILDSDGFVPNCEYISSIFQGISCPYPHRGISELMVSHPKTNQSPMLQSFLPLASAMGWRSIVSMILATVKEIKFDIWYYSIKYAIGSNSKIVKLLLDDERCDQGPNAYRFIYIAQRDCNANSLKVLVHHKKIRGDIRIRGYGKRAFHAATEEIYISSLESRFG
jgi:hypothetical protein